MLERVTVFHVTVDIPNDGVQLIPGMDEEMRSQIVDGLVAISKTEEGQNALDTAYGWSALEEHGNEFYEPFRRVLQASGVSIKDLFLE